MEESMNVVVRSANQRIVRGANNDYATVMYQAMLTSCLVGYVPPGATHGDEVQPDGRVAPHWLNWQRSFAIHACASC